MDDPKNRSSKSIFFETQAIHFLDLSRAWGGGGHRCREAENYGVSFAKYLAKAVTYEEDFSQQVYAADHVETGTLRQLATNHGAHAARIAHRRHGKPWEPPQRSLAEVARWKAGE